MSARPAVGGWLKGTTVRKGAAGGSSTATSSRSHTPQVQSTSTTVFGGGVKDPSGRTSEFFSMDDQCPVCKSDRYLNPKLRLLVSSCYHKMCESCIDRLFTLGPAPCPICNKVLRKLAFTPQTFEDLGVEKEVAVRRRMAREFNKRREDFLDLRSFNDYLEEVEDITFNLINDIDVAETEARITKYRAENAALIAANTQHEAAQAQALKDAEELDKQERLERARDARRLEEEERAEREKEKQEIIDRLESADDAEDAKRLVTKLRRQNARQLAVQQAEARNQARLMRSRAAMSATVPDVPHAPLQDDYYAYADKYVVREAYEDPWSEAVRRDKDGIMRAGGYRVEEAWERAVRCAVAGLELTPLSGMGSEMAAAVEPGDIVMAS